MGRKRSPESIRRHDREVRAKRAVIRLRRARLRSSYPKSAAVPQPFPRRRFNKASVKVAIPADFCFLSNPEAVLQLVAEARELTYREDLYEIVADFSGCKNLGLGALVVLHQTLVDGRQRLFNTTGATFEVMAIPSGTDDVDRILNAPGAGFASQPVNIVRSPILRGRSAFSEFSKERDKAGTEIVDYLDRCLHTERLALSPEGRKYIGNLVTETLGNAEDHSGPWTAQGYFLQRSQGDPGVCHIVLFNVGATIHERMTGKGASPGIRADAQALARRHLDKGFFLPRLFKRWNEEALITLFALQEGVSSRLHERSSRGNGTIEIIRAFSRLSGKEQRMCILSGSSYILFDGTYDLTERSTDQESRRVIAFNETNDLEQPPNDRYVYSLDRRFEGTILDLRFPLDRTKLKTIADEEANG